MTNFNNTFSAGIASLRPKAKTIWARFKKKMDELDERLPEIIQYTCKMIGRFINGCINTAVKLSIILIALIMVQTFIETHPAEWANCVSTVTNAFDAVKNAAVGEWENMMDNLFWFIR